MQLTPETTAPLASSGRRRLLGMATAVAGASMLVGRAHAEQSGGKPAAGSEANTQTGPLRRGLIGYMLPHEQFPIPQLIRQGAMASQAGFRLLATSDHLQPWQANEGHAGQAWVTLAALGGHAPQSWMGTTVTCPTMRYNPAVVAEAFASLSDLYPGRIFLGVGSGEAINEQAATGMWPKWPERWDRLVEAIGIIRRLWAGEELAHQGKYYNVHARLWDLPRQPLPLLTAANGVKSMRLAGIHGDGLITDPKTWQQHKARWEDGARSAGKNPTDMPVLVEQYVVVGDQQVAQDAAELWRFGPKAFKTYYDNPSPGGIQHLAEQQIPISEVVKSWAVGTDPEVHIRKLQSLFDSGASIVNVHSGQPDQERVIEFYARNVLPHFRQPSVSVGQTRSVSPG
jgi:F420-dependent hydroxymycolic acid dehydrogenase